MRFTRSTIFIPHISNTIVVFHCTYNKTLLRNCHSHGSRDILFNESIRNFFVINNHVTLEQTQQDRTHIKFSPRNFKEKSLTLERQLIWLLKRSTSVHRKEIMNVLVDFLWFIHLNPVACSLYKPDNNNNNNYINNNNNYNNNK